jgi:16S rRNA (cytosine1402-N4)-methyltransferase
MSEPAVHVPVLRDEVLEYLHVRPGCHYVDCTVNGGGHAAAVLEASAPDGRLLGIDRDPDLVAALRMHLAAAADSGRLRLTSGNFRALSRILTAHHFTPVDGILLDLGLSSYHLDVSGRGFSFARDEPLDMRFDPESDDAETAAEILASRDAEELTALFRSWGEERFASRIARSIVARRREAPLKTTAELLQAIERSLPANVRWRAGRHAARVFQALRIAANDELDAVAEVLPQAVAALRPGGRLVIISFHSLEDRMAKYFLRDEARAGRLEILTKRPLTATDEEIAANSRAASAKLRAAERL